MMSSYLHNNSSNMYCNSYYSIPIAPSFYKQSGTRFNQQINVLHDIAYIIVVNKTCR